MTGRLAVSLGPGSGPAKRDAVLAAGTAVFLEQGFGAASMDEVARRAQVSKATIYSYFEGKQALFEAIIGERCACMVTEGIGGGLADRPPAEALAEIARRILDVLLSTQALPLYRVVLAESARFPELGVSFYRSGPDRLAGALTGFLADQHIRGTLDVPNPRLAAEQFVGMVLGHIHLRLLLGIAPAPSPEERERSVAQAVRTFIGGVARAPASPAP